MGAVRLCGIYTTALAKLLSENGIEASSSDAGLETGFADTLVYDKEDENGVTVNGALSDKIVEVMKKSLPDAIYHKTETGAIYCGLVKEIDRDGNKVVINIGCKKLGELPIQSYWGLFKEGEKVLVQVKGETRENILLSTQLRLFGDNLILIKKGFTKVSKHIKDPKERGRLLELSEDFKVDGWGILWKALAEDKEDKELEKDIKRLLKEEEEIRKSFGVSKGIKRLRDGLCIHFIDFGKESKEFLDKMRSKVKPTMAGHHTLKSMGYPFAAELGDSLSGKKNVVKDVVLENISPGQHYRVVQNKITDRAICMRGRVLDTNSKVEIRRNVRAVGTYKGLGIPKERGDYSVVSVKDGEMFVKETYFDADGKRKGALFSICTPVELSPTFARSIGLELCVVEQAGKRELLNLELMEEAVKCGSLSKGLKDKAMKIAKEIIGDKVG